MPAMLAEWFPDRRYIHPAFTGYDEPYIHGIQWMRYRQFDDQIESSGCQHSQPIAHILFILAALELLGCIVPVIFIIVGLLIQYPHSITSLIFRSGRRLVNRMIGIPIE